MEGTNRIMRSGARDQIPRIGHRQEDTYVYLPNAGENRGRNRARREGVAVYYVRRLLSWAIYRRVESTDWVLLPHRLTTYPEETALSTL